MKFKIQKQCITPKRLPFFRLNRILRIGRLDYYFDKFKAWWENKQIASSRTLRLIVQLSLKVKIQYFILIFK